MNGMIRFFFWVAVIGGAICAIGYYAFFDVWTVPGDDPRLAASVQPTLVTGDIVLVKRHGEPGLGNLVRCLDPDEPRRFIVARIAATDTTIHLSGQGFSTPGSRPTAATACGNRRLVSPATGDDVELSCREEDFAGTTYQVLQKGDYQSDKDLNVTVPSGRAFLMSDDRFLHLDSRDYGSLPLPSCQHIVFRLWGAAGFTDASRRFNLIW
jgi:signal peptidase I